jgi:hypothetical protein
MTSMTAHRFRNLPYYGAVIDCPYRCELKELTMSNSPCRPVAKMLPVISMGGCSVFRRCQNPLSYRSVVAYGLKATSLRFTSALTSTFDLHGRPIPVYWSKISEHSLIISARPASKYPKIHRPTIVIGFTHTILSAIGSNLPNA